MKRLWIAFSAILLLSFVLQAEDFEPLAKYNRKNYRHWIDEDRDCQNTRAEVLIQTSIEEVTFKNPKQCVVTSGFWVDPFSGKSFFKASDLNVDHIIPLKAAHEGGAARWPAWLKKQFANDSQNLIVVSKRLNRRKGAKTPLEWMPPNESYRCDYLARWQELNSTYKLSFNDWEQIEDMFASSCKDPYMRAPATSKSRRKPSQ